MAIQAPPQVADDNLKPLNVNDGPTSGNPTTPAISRSVVEGTSTAVSNSNLAHVCDITGSMRYSIAWVSLQIKELIEAVRQAIQKLWSSLSNSPFGDGANGVVKAIQNMVSQINKLIQKAKEAQAAVQGYITQLQQLLAYIQSLPARLSQFLAQCISDATASIKDAISNAQSIVNSQSNGSINTAAASATTASEQLTTAQTTQTGSSSGPAVGKP